MVRYWLPDAANRGRRQKSTGINVASARWRIRPSWRFSSSRRVHSPARGRVSIIIPLLVLAFYGVNRMAVPEGWAGDSAPVLRRSRSPRPPRTRCSFAVDASSTPATQRGALATRRADRRRPTSARVHVAGLCTHRTAIRARSWWDVAGGSPAARAAAPTDGRVEALLEEVWKLPRGESQLRHRRRAGAVPPALAARSDRGAPTFRLKLRLLNEPSVVDHRRPGGRRRAPETPTPRGSSDACSSPACTAPRCGRSPTRAHSSLDDVRAVFFAFDADEARRIRQDWEPTLRHRSFHSTSSRRRSGTSAIPCGAYLREITAEFGYVIAVVVMPELAVHGWRKAAAQPVGAVPRVSASCCSSLA